jgi:hypothetical protein
MSRVLIAATASLGIGTQGQPVIVINVEVSVCGDAGGAISASYSSIHQLHALPAALAKGLWDTASFAVGLPESVSKILHDAQSAYDSVTKALRVQTNQMLQPLTRVSTEVVHLPPNNTRVVLV